jgi:hypothetical protein
MTPPKINPAFAKYVVSVEPELPAYLANNKAKLQFLDKGLTSHGVVRKIKSSGRRRKQS